MNCLYKYAPPPASAHHRRYSRGILYGLATILLLLFWLLPVVCQGSRGGGTTVLIAKNTQLSGFEYRIKAELESTGFTVEMFDMDFREDTQRIVDLRAHAHNAAAAIICRLSAGNVEIWIADKVTNKTVLRKVAIPQDEDAESFVAISTVELLRASLLEIHTVSELTGTVPPTKEIEQLIAPRESDSDAWRRIAPNNRKRFSVQINPTIMKFRIDGNPNINIQFAGSYAFHRHFEVKLHGQTPILPQKIVTEEGEITVYTGYAAVAINWLMVAYRYLASGDLGIGMAIISHRIAGQPVAGNIGFQKTYALPAPHLTFGIDVRLSGDLRARLETMAGWMLSRLVVTVDREKILSMGNFFVSIGAGLMFVF